MSNFFKWTPGRVSIPFQGKPICDLDLIYLSKGNPTINSWLWHLVRRKNLQAVDNAPSAFSNQSTSGEVHTF
jgi:hypothetical protein